MYFWKYLTELWTLILLAIIFKFFLPRHLPIKTALLCNTSNRQLTTFSEQKMIKIVILTEFENLKHWNQIETLKVSVPLLNIYENGGKYQLCSAVINPI